MNLNKETMLTAKINDLPGSYTYISSNGKDANRFSFDMKPSILVIKVERTIMAKCLIWNDTYYDIIMSECEEATRKMDEEIFRQGLIAMPENYSIKCNRGEFVELEDKSYLGSFKGYHIDGEDIVFKKNMEHRGSKIVALDPTKLKIYNKDSTWDESMIPSAVYDDGRSKIEGFNVGTYAPTVLRITEDEKVRMVYHPELSSYEKAEHLPINLRDEWGWINAILGCKYAYVCKDGTYTTTSIKVAQDTDVLLNIVFVDNQ